MTEAAHYTSRPQEAPEPPYGHYREPTPVMARPLSETVPQIPPSMPQEAAPQQVLHQEEGRGVVVPMLLLLPGVFFLLFSLILLLFSNHGLLTLQWKAQYWFIYAGVALPLLYFGWRSLGSQSHE